jgi:hypothetical protein
MITCGPMDSNTRYVPAPSDSDSGPAASSRATRAHILVTRDVLLLSLLSSKHIGIRAS